MLSRNRKNSHGSVVHFPDLETKQYFVESRYKRLRKEDVLSSKPSASTVRIVCWQ